MPVPVLSQFRRCLSARADKDRGAQTSVLLPIVDIEEFLSLSGECFELLPHVIIGYREKFRHFLACSNAALMLT
jgi:hypothetical protein